MASTSSSPLLQLFWDLASLKAEERVTAAEKLRKNVQELQQAHADTLNDQDRDKLTEKRVASDEIDALCHPDVAYTLKRLIKGLSSDRKGARQGFATALTEVLPFVDFIPASIVFDWIKTHNDLSSGLKGSEERAILYGRVFGFAALLRAECNQDWVSTEELQTIFTSLFEIASKKPYLRELCLGIVLDKCRQFDNEDLFQWICDQQSDQELTYESLTLMMYLKSRIADLKLPELFSLWPDNQAILTSINMAHIAACLKDSHEIAHPRVHSCWSTWFTCILDQCTSDSYALFQDFWTMVIDQSLFQSSSLERKFSALRLFEMALPLALEKQIPAAILFTPHFVRCLVSSVTNPQLNLHKMARSTVQVILKYAENNRALALQFVAALSGVKKFGVDSLVGLQKTVKSKQLVEEILLAGLAGDEEERVRGIEEYLEWLMKTFCNQQESSSTASSAENDGEEPKETPVETHRRWCMDQMVSLVKNSKIQKAEAWVFSLVRFFVLNAFYTIVTPFEDAQVPELKMQCTPELSDRTRAVMRKRFWSLLSDLCVQGTGKLSEGRSANGQHVLQHVLDIMKTLNAKTKAKKSKKPKLEKLLKSAPETTEILKKAFKLVEKLQDGEKDKRSRALETLTLLIMVQLTTSGDESEVTELCQTLDDVCICVGKLTSGKKDADEELDPAAVFSDLIVALLANQPESNVADSDESSQSGSLALSIRLTRHIAEDAFRALCLQMPVDASLILARVIDTTLVDISSEEDEETDMEVGDEEHDHSSHCESESSDSDSENEEVNPELIEALKSKLGNGVRTQDSDESDDDLLDDDQMVDMGFDAKLAEIFRNRKMEKKQKQSAAKASTDFKFRVLDLIDGWFREANKSEAVCVSSLLQLGRSLLVAAVTIGNPASVIASANSAAKSSSEKEEKTRLREFAERVNVELSQIGVEHRNLLVSRIVAILRNRVVKTHLTYSSSELLKDEFSRAISDCVYIMTGQVVECLGQKSDLASYPLGGNKEVTPVCGDYLLWLVKQLAMNTKAADADMNALSQDLSKLYGGSFLKMHLTKNVSRGHIPASVFLDFVRKNPYVGLDDTPGNHIWTVLGLCVVDTLSSDETISAYQKSQLWHILGETLKHASGVSEKFWKTIISRLAKLFKVTLKSIHDSASNEDLAMKSSKVKDILCIVLDALRKSKKFSPATDISTAFDLVELAGIADHIATHATYEKTMSIKNMVIQIKSVAMPKDAGAKRKQVDADETTFKPKKVKKS